MMRNWIRGGLLTGGVTSIAVGIAEGPFWVYGVIGAVVLVAYQRTEPQR